MATAKERAPAKKAKPGRKSKNEPLTLAKKSTKTRSNATSNKAASTATKEQKKRVIGKPFPKGVSGNPAGRPKGSKNVIIEDFLSALAADFKEHGVEAIEQMRVFRPHDYIKVVAGLVPKDQNINVGGEAFANMWQFVSSNSRMVAPAIDDDDDMEYYGSSLQ